MAPPRRNPRRLARACRAWPHATATALRYLGTWQGLPIIGKEPFHFEGYFVIQTLPQPQRCQLRRAKLYPHGLKAATAPFFPGHNAHIDKLSFMHVAHRNRQNLMSLGDPCDVAVPVHPKPAASGRVLAGAPSPPCRQTWTT
jgi:hypothetical protein